MAKKIKDPAAVELGRRGGLKGGKARARKLSARRRTQQNLISPPGKRFWQKRCGKRVSRLSRSILLRAALSPRKIDGESVHRTAGGGRRDDDYWRDLQLQSLGWQVCRFWVYELREDLPRCVQRVIRLLKA